MDALPHPVLVIQPDDFVAYANAAAEVFFGASARMLQRRRLPELAPFASPLIALVSQVRRAHATVNEYAIDLGMPDVSASRLVDIYAATLPEDESQVLIMLQQRSMAQMIERQLSHRGAARSVSGMAAILAHEIKNPLSGIRGAAQLLETGVEGDDRALAQLICQEADRICTLVDRMEVFGDERPIKFEPVNIHVVLDHVKRIAANGFARHITFLQNFDPSLPPVPGNRDKLIQVFLNLVKNAAEAVGDQRGDGQITLATAFKPGLRISTPNSDSRISLPLEISVIDNGPGIPDELRPHLFEPFVTTKPKGAGLGLALVAKIVNDHGGVIECDAKARATAFRVMMPMYQTADRKSKEH
ncbi:MAG: ATP-binding protein [Hyphomicrobiales bacterium]|nr:ATP-binding protein [Hyphomicrobiales bacterium]